MPDATTVEQAYAGALTALLARGFVHIADSPDLRTVEALAQRRLVVGARVCNEGQRWYEARNQGTGTVRAVLHKPFDSWEKTYGRPNVEVIVERDEVLFGSAVATWSDYGTHVAYEWRNAHPLAEATSVGETEPA